MSFVLIGDVYGDLPVPSSSVLFAVLTCVDEQLVSVSRLGCVCDRTEASTLCFCLVLLGGLRLYVCG